MAGKPFVQPRWVVIATYRNIPLPILPIPPYKKPTKWPPAYLLRSKRVPIVVNTDTDAVTDTVNLDSTPDGGAG
jgi:hypothetical protein